MSVPDYRKAGNQLIYDLIEESNPGFKDYVPIGSAAFGTPVSQTVEPGTIQNTNIVVKGKSGSAAIGQKTIKYRRVDLSKLFRGKVLRVTEWSSGSTLSVARFCELMLEQHGVNLSVDDVGNIGTFAVNTAKTFTVAPASLCYIGSITVTWVLGKRKLTTVAGDGLLPGRNWPDAMIDFGDGSKPQGELLVYNLDYSVHRASWLSFASGTVYTSNVGDFVTQLNLLSTPAGLTFSGGTIATANGLSNVKVSRYALPNAAVPEANSAQFGFCLVFEPQQDAWFFGRMIAHFN